MNSLFLPIKTRPGMNSRENWRVKASRNKIERTAARLAFSSAFRGHPLPSVVTIVRLSAATMDDDNLPGAAKAIRDGIADAMGVKDNDPRIRWAYEQRKCRRGEFGVIIEVQP